MMPFYDTARRTALGFRPRSYLLVALWVAMTACCAQGQSNIAKPNASAGSSSFSIETEMLTYRALESNSEAIACDVASVLSGAKPDFNHPADGAACAPPANGQDTTIVLLPFEKSELEDFAEWRATMAELAELQAKAAALGCPKNPYQETSRAGTSTSSLSSFLSMSPAGPPLALAQSALGLFKSEEATTSVGGNIQDLAFINDVARQLEALHIVVVTSSLYDPEDLTAADESTSPFLASKERTLLARGCLSALKPANDQNAAEIKQAISDIDDYMATFTGDKPAKPSNDASAGDNGPTGSDGASSNSASGDKPAKPPNGASAGNNGPSGSDGASSSSAGGTSAGAQSSMSAILRADGLAQKLGFRFDSETGKLMQPSTGYFVLMVKALESGGSVTGRSNILGTKLRYSGGAVGTYALFAADGGLACSGNVYDYAGSLSAKHFERDLRKVPFDPSQQVIFRVGGCPAEKSSAPQSNSIH